MFYRNTFYFYLQKTPLKISLNLLKREIKTKRTNKMPFQRKFKIRTFNVLLLFSVSFNISKKISKKVIFSVRIILKMGNRA